MRTTAQDQIEHAGHVINSLEKRLLGEEDLAALKVLWQEYNLAVIENGHLKKREIIFQALVAEHERLLKE